MKKLLSQEKFYLFGMGKRPKMIWKNHYKQKSSFHSFFRQLDMRLIH